MRPHFLTFCCPPKQGFRAPRGLHPVHLELLSLLSLFQFVRHFSLVVPSGEGSSYSVFN